MRMHATQQPPNRNVYTTGAANPNTTQTANKDPTDLDHQPKESGPTPAGRAKVDSMQPHMNARCNMNSAKYNTV